MNVSIFDNYFVIIDPCASSDGTKPRDLHVDDPGAADLMDRYFDTLWLRGDVRAPSPGDGRGQQGRLRLSVWFAYAMFVVASEALTWGGALPWLSAHPNGYGIRFLTYFGAACVALAGTSSKHRSPAIVTGFIGALLALAALLGGLREGGDVNRSHLSDTTRVSPTYPRQ